MARRELPELAAPDPIRPAGLQSDTFAQAAPPPVDNSLSQLAEGLGAFNRGLMQYYDKWSAEDKKKQLQEKSAALDHWVNTTPIEQQFEAGRAGTIPVPGGMNDKYFGPTLAKFYGQLAARELAYNQDKMWEEGKIPFGSATFNPDRHILEQANPIAERFRNNPYAQAGFREGLDALRKSFIEKNDNARRQNAELAASNALSDQVTLLVRKSAKAGEDGQITSDAMRELLRALGPSQQGGTLGMRLAKSEEIALNAIERMLETGSVQERVAIAAQVEQIMVAKRGDVLGTGVDLPSYKDDVRFADKAQGILKKAAQAKFDFEKASVEGDFKRRMLTAMVEGDAETVETMTRMGLTAPSRILEGKVHTLGGEAVQKEMQKAYLGFMRAQGKGDIAFEINQMTQAGLDHPEAVAAIKVGFSTGLAAFTNPTGPLDQQALQKLIRGHEMYALYSTLNPEWPSKLSADERKFYDTYSILIEQAGSEPLVAAQQMRVIYSDRARRTDPEAVRGRARDLESAINGLRTDRLWDSISIPGWSSTPENRGLLMEQAKPLADALLQANGYDAPTAIKEAVKKIQTRGVMINGQLLFGIPGLTKDDAPIIQERLTDVYNIYKNELAIHGVNSPKDLSVQPVGKSGQFIVVSRPTGSPIIGFGASAARTPLNVVAPGARPDDEPEADRRDRGRIGLPMQPLTFDLKGVSAERRARAKAEYEAQLKKATEKPAENNKWISDLIYGAPYPYKTDGSSRWTPGSAANRPNPTAEILGELAKPYVDDLRTLEQEGPKRDAARRAREKATNENLRQGLGQIGSSISRRLNSGNMLERK